jgi:hypothetical protein
MTGDRTPLRCRIVAPQVVAQVGLPRTGTPGKLPQTWIPGGNALTGGRKHLCCRVATPQAVTQVDGAILEARTPTGDYIAARMLLWWGWNNVCYHDNELRLD